MSAITALSKPAAAGRVRRRQSHVAVDVLESVSGTGHRQVGVQDKLESTRSLVIMKPVFAGLEGEEAIFPGERRAAKEHKSPNAQTTG